jgi:hypothetical protein
MDTYAMQEQPVESRHASLTREMDAAVGVEATMRFFRPDAIYDASRAGLDVLHGEEAIRSFMEWMRVGSEFIPEAREANDEPKEVIDLGQGVVLTYGSALSDALILVWEDDQVSSLIVYLDVGEATAAAEGLVVERAQS